MFLFQQNYLSVTPILPGNYCEQSVSCGPIGPLLYKNVAKGQDLVIKRVNVLTINKINVKIQESQK